MCPRRTRTGCTLVPNPEDDSVHDSGNSAERIDKPKSAPDERRTREDGKNVREVTLETCGFETSLRLLVLIVGAVVVDGRGVEG